MTLLKTIQTIRKEGFSVRVREQYSSEELYVVQKILEEFDEFGRSFTLDALFRNDYEITPVSIDEFLSDDYYLGRVGCNVYETWRDDLREVLSPLNNIGEWVIKGSIGSGKTFVAVIANLYKIYCLLCLHNPQKFYGLAEGSPIVFGLFNIYKYLAGATSYQYLTTWLRDMSPFFAEKRGDSGKSKKRLTDKEVLDLPKGIQVALGAAAIHALGQNIYGGLPLAKGTRISLLNGEEVPIEELEGQKFWVYGLKEGKFVPAFATCFKSGRSPTKLITLDNGEVIECTVEHQWMMRDGVYKETKDLLPGDSLMPFRRRVNDTGYEEVFHPGKGWEKTHQAVVKYLYGGDFYKSPIEGEGPWVVHHKDLNKRNNSPENLDKLTFRDHAHLHETLVAAMHSPESRAKWAASMEKKYQDTEWVEKRRRISSETISRTWKKFREDGEGRIGIGFRERSEAARIRARERIIVYNKTPEARKRSGERLRKWNRENPDKLRDNARKYGGVALRRATKKVVPLDIIVSRYKELLSLGVPFLFWDLAYAVGVPCPALARSIKLAGIKNYAEFKEIYNHKVVSVESSGEVKDVYCLCVPSTSNYGITAGVVSHNCDETEFGKSKSMTSQEKSQVADLYHNVRTRMDSRFMQRGGVNPGLLCLVSSARDYEQFLAQHVRATQDTGTTFVSQYALYEIKKEVYRDSKRFTVVVGDKLHRSYIIGKENPQVRSGARTVEVPEEFRPAFEYDIDAAIRDIAGVETYGSTLFFPKREALLGTLETSTPRKHPFTRDEVTLGLEDDVGLDDYFIKDEMVVLWDKTNQLYRPKYYPHADRYIHVDLAKNRDCAGISMTCVSKMTVVNRLNKLKMPVKARDYVHFVDLMLRIRAAHGSEIDFSKIREFIFFLMDTCKFKVKWISYDSYQSTDSIQTWKKEKIQAKELSLDRTPGPYRTFKSVLLEGRFDWYYYDPFFSELTTLEDHTLEGGKKIDHPVGGSKDVSDSVCGSVCGSLLAKGSQVTGTDADQMLERSNSYMKARKDPPKLTSVGWVKPEVGNTNPLENLFDD